MELQTPQNAMRHGMAWETSAAIERMKTGKPGDQITREEWATLLKCDVAPNSKSKGYRAICTAIRHVERTYQVVWRWCREMQLYKCLEHGERLVEQRRLKGTARRAVRRGLIVSEAIDSAKLTDEERQQWHGEQAIMAVMMTAGSAPAAKRLECESQHNPPNLDQLMRLFKKE